MMQKNAMINHLVQHSFKIIAPFWPLQNLIAVNPLQGLEDLPIEDALNIGASYFTSSDLPDKILLINNITIKWLEAYCDEGQATIKMPLKELGLYASWRLLAPYDAQLHQNITANIEFLQHLPTSSEQALTTCLRQLHLAPSEQQEFLTLLLTTLPGWAAYIKYKTAWSTPRAHAHQLNQVEYLAVRSIITTIVWPQARELLQWHQKNHSNLSAHLLETIATAEHQYRMPLLQKIAAQPLRPPHTPAAQIVFCIDVRSEPLRKALEASGDYQTLGFAGFFGIPVQITDKITGVSYPSCPVLMQPQHEVFNSASCHAADLRHKNNHDFKQALKKIYLSLKYNFTTPFALVETLGGFSGIWMAIRTALPTLAAKISTIVSRTSRTPNCIEPSIAQIPFTAQCTYAATALKMMGLTDHFAPIILFCGHGSSTQNNAYATALDCGACGGRHGGNNAKILAAIMNCTAVRTQLAKNDLAIPHTTKFYAAEHNTTTDEVVIFGSEHSAQLTQLRQHFDQARVITTSLRLKQLNVHNYHSASAKIRAHDWAQTRPEWGLSRNAAFIVAPRDCTAALDLDGRCFLHSYDYQHDPHGSLLTTILTAPMIVAQWINMQYFFSSINNVAYGSGSKITQNITGKIGIMQGNASDLMTGLPLQSLYKSDTEPYHEAQRLFVVVIAPQIILEQIIQTQPILQKLFGNGWVQLAMITPESHQAYLLKRDCTWQLVHSYHA